MGTGADLLARRPHAVRGGMQYTGRRGGSQAGSRKHALQTGLAAAAPQHILQQQHCQPPLTDPASAKRLQHPAPRRTAKSGSSEPRGDARSTALSRLKRRKVPRSPPPCGPPRPPPPRGRPSPPPPSRRCCLPLASSSDMEPGCRLPPPSAPPPCGEAAERHGAGGLMPAKIQQQVQVEAELWEATHRSQQRRTTRVRPAAAGGGGGLALQQPSVACISLHSQPLPCRPSGVAPGRRCRCHDLLLGPGRPLQARRPRC